MFQTLTTQEFIDRARLIHGTKYDYSLVEYKSTDMKVIIICPIHGNFEQTPNLHLSYKGCRECGYKRQRTKLSKTKYQFITESNKIHNNKYSYDKFIYVNSYTKGIITCPKHGDFLQTPQTHIDEGCGCPKCKRSKGEETISQYLESQGYFFIPQKWFSDCRGTKYPLPFDFYLPDHNILIEFQGRQHYIPIPYWGGKDDHIKLKVTDTIKKAYCKAKNIPLIEIRYDTKDIIGILEKEIAIIVSAQVKQKIGV